MQVPRSNLEVTGALDAMYAEQDAKRTALADAFSDDNRVWRSESTTQDAEYYRTHNRAGDPYGDAQDNTDGDPETEELLTENQDYPPTAIQVPKIDNPVYGDAPTVHYPPDYDTAGKVPHAQDRYWQSVSEAAENRWGPNCMSRHCHHGK